MLSQIIKEIQSEIRSKIDNLNSGGCGWFAFYMATALKSVGIEAEIKLITRHEGDLWFTQKDDINYKKEIINEYVNNGEQNCDPSDLQETSFIHCYINVAGFEFDGMYESFKDMKEYFKRFKFEGDYTIEEMEIALKVGGWNCTYDTSNNAKLKEIIERGLMPLRQPTQLA